jgi:hypothetical protein
LKLSKEGMVIVMNTKKWLYALSGVTILAVLSAAILIYTDYKGATNFTVVSAPKQEDVESPIKVEKTEVNFAEIDLGNNLASGKKIIANNYTQTYVGKYAIDGDVKTYWEGAPESYPNTLVLDLESPIDVKCLRIKLNPNNMWERRKQNLSIHGSMDDKNYTELAGAADYVFDPISGNAVIINFNTRSIRYLKLEFIDNTAATGGQAAEVEVY